MEGKPVARLSQKMQGELMKWKEKGYVVVSASVRFIVAWKPKDAPKEEEETAVILADLTLSTQPCTTETHSRGGTDCPA